MLGWGCHLTAFPQTPPQLCRASSASDRSAAAGSASINGGSDGTSDRDSTFAERRASGAQASTSSSSGSGSRNPSSSSGSSSGRRNSSSSGSSGSGSEGNTSPRSSWARVRGGQFSSTPSFPQRGETRSPGKGAPRGPSQQKESHDGTWDSRSRPRVEYQQGSRPRRNPGVAPPKKGRWEDQVVRAGAGRKSFQHGHVYIEPEEERAGWQPGLFLRKLQVAGFLGDDGVQVSFRQPNI